MTNTTPTAPALDADLIEDSRWNVALVAAPSWNAPRGLEDLPSFEPIRRPIDSTQTTMAVNRNWNRRGAHVSKVTR